MRSPFLTSLETATAERAVQMPSPFRDLTTKEIERYSLSREVRRILFNGGVAVDGTRKEGPGFERELTRAAFVCRHNGREVDPDRTVIVPPQVFAQVFERAMATTPGSKGGYLVPTGVESPLGVIDALRPLSAVLRAGAQSVSGFTSNVAVPRQTGDVTVTWQAGEGTSVSAADPALGQLSIAAKTVIAIVNFSRQLLVQAPKYLDMMLTRTFGAAIASELDKVALQGAGGATPLGILNTPGIPTVTGTSLAVAGLLSFQRKLLDNNGQSAPLNFAFVTTPAVGEILAQRTNFATGTAAAVWQGSLAEGRVLGAPAYCTPNMLAATMVGGDFSRLLVSEFFDGIELSFQHANYAAGTIAGRAMLTCDVGVEHLNSFVVSTSIT
jgi:HK97 family phage major capsid protein